MNHVHRARRSGNPRFAISALTASMLLVFATASHAAGPVGGVVVSGVGDISSAGTVTTINQSTGNLIINWDGFSIGAGESVQFLQPDTSSVALNRVIGPDPSVILGSLTANGNVFLVNANGVLFGHDSSVNVGGLVATTMDVSTADFLAGRYAFSDAGSGSIVNNGRIQAADGGYVALMGRSVSNQGVISARLGTVALAAGANVTLDVAGDGLLKVAVAKGAVNALVENGGLVQADGGVVVMTAQGAGALLDTVVNNTGVVRARSLQDRNGTILLLADHVSGTVNLSGMLDASAPDGGNGGFIETSAANVLVGNAVQVSTAAAHGATGQWLIDPQDFTIGSAPGDNIAGATLSQQLVTNNVTITTEGAGTDNGDINVNDAVSWSASGGPTTLTLLADRDVNINAAITATNGNLATCCGRDVNVNSAITTTNGSVLLAAGNDANIRGAITVTDGNLLICAADDVHLFSAITLTRGTADPTRSLGLSLGLTLSADTDGSGPGIEGGTVIFDSLAPPTTVTAAPARIYYNPVSYTAPTDYSQRFTLTEGAALSQFMLVFAAGGDKVYDGTTTATLSGLKGDPTGVTLVAGQGARADFDSPDVGSDKQITFSGYTLAGSDAGDYALPVNCCGPETLAHTTGAVTAVPPDVPPPDVPPPGDTPPGDTPPGDTPPGDTPPVDTPPVDTPPVDTPPVVPSETVPATPPVTAIHVAPPLGIVNAPPAPATLVEVTQRSPQPVVLSMVKPPEKVPYVAPVMKPKPYRN